MQYWKLVETALSGETAEVRGHRAGWFTVIEGGQPRGVRMNRELAQMVVMTAIRAGCDLADLPPVLKEHGEYDKDEAIRMAIATAIYETGEVLDRVF